MEKKVLGYRLWVMGWVISLIFLQTGCFAQEEDPYLWDFGEIKQLDIVEHVFVLKNESEKTLNIDKVNTSCGCTASNLEKNSLLPGESAEIEVKFDSKGYIGPVTQYVYVNTDSPENPVIQLTIKAEVVKAVDSPKTQS